ncbi:Adenylyl cyclase-associated protein [Golovinomyces cichoracearum]|uniref:Adenylyl cyclase-associated protein n=1 Tax=Golovinomyces cichoracearum TaxID=62708 RepID=A0A420H1J6_9PEZI|nr:Adenylyl cyclase-associated protein [Golovinomyces cichoracearum]
MATPPGTGNMHNLTTLIKRLEAATSRLEDMASMTIPPSNINRAAVSSPTGPVNKLPESNAEESKIVPEALPESVEGFDAFISGPVQSFVNISNELGGPISEQARSLLNAFYGQRKFIFITTKAKKPDLSSAIFMELLKPLQESITAVSEIRDSNRGSPVFNQLSAVSESIGFLAWITVEPKPRNHIDEFYGSAQYWGNRVLKEFKEKDPKQVEWTQLYYQVFKSLSEYVQETFPSGILWNPQGIPAEEAMKVVDSTSTLPTATKNKNTAGSIPPPPPGPAPPPIKLDNESKDRSSKKTSSLDAVFSELNKGSEITKRLNKVNVDQMTHKNPSLRAGSTVLTRSNSNTSEYSPKRAKSSAPGKKPKPENMRTKKPAIKKLEGNKWFLENIEEESEPIRIDASITQSILISRCKKSTIIIQGKANAISVDNSHRLSLIIDSLVSSVDVIKSSSFAIQVLGSLPTILIDSVDGAQIYLGKESMGVGIFSSQSTGININFESNEKEDEYKEVPIPSQIRTWIEEGNVKSEIVEHAG